MQSYAKLAIYFIFVISNIFYFIVSLKINHQKREKKKRKKLTRKSLKFIKDEEAIPQMREGEGHSRFNDEHSSYALMLLLCFFKSYKPPHL